MALIRIQEIPGTATTTDGSNGTSTAQATISFDNGPSYSITISDPFKEEEEKELEWYFEEHLRFPFIDTVRARNAGQSVTTYGETLFKQVFGDPDVYAAYKQCLTAGANTLQIEIAGSPSFHRWHWEALKDPRLPQALALQATMVRKNVVPQAISATMRQSPTINLLVVVARPSGRRDVGYRTISRPLVESLRQTNVPVQIDILRPGTYKALDNHLREVTARHSVGYYHIVHFDMHGALLPYAQFQEGPPEVSSYVYKNRYGRGPLQEYTGYKAFLAFEDEQSDQADLAEAGELAQLLTTHQIPVAILNACQSGKQVEASETSLGSRLMQAGVQLVLAMGYSVTTSAAEILMKKLYGQLFDKHDLATAISHARQELYNNKERRAYFDQTILLEDWLLPVVYQNQPQHLTPHPFEPDESARYYGQQAERYKATEPGYGFVGRDLDILQIEKRLLTKKNILLICGMGGAGKTTLLQHLGQWWQTTGFVEHVFYFGYDTRAWTRQQLLTNLAKALLTDVEYVRDFQPLPLASQQVMISQKLRSTRHLLILDNLESITGSHMAIRHTLSRKEQTALHSFLKDLSGGKTIVLLGSRSGEQWLAPETFGNNLYDLAGLDQEAASLLTDRILKKYGVSKYRKEEDLRRLIKLLDGFPLALEVVLANLARQTPTEVLAALQSGDVDLNTGDSQERTKNILRCIDYSHSNLSPDAQALLVCLAPFTSIIDTDWLDKYTDYLKQQPALAKLPFEHWQEVIQEATNWGLLSIDPHIRGHLHIQPTLPYFLRSRLNVPEQTDIRAAVETAFRELYSWVGDGLYQLLKSKDPQERQMGIILVRQEYENLMTALKLALDAQISVLNIYKTLSSYLDVTQEHTRGLDLGTNVLKRLEMYSPEKLEGAIGAELVGVIDNIAKRQLLLKQYEAAEDSYQKALSIWQKNTRYNSDEIKKSSASIYHQLGVVAQEQRQWEQAEHYYQQALQIKIEYNARYEQAHIYHQLGMVAQEQRQWPQAEHYYQQALQIYIEYNDRYEQADTYHQLGRVAQEQRQWQQAEQYYQQALQIYIEYNARYEQASTYHQLGRVAQEQRQWPQAEQYYQQALQIYIEFNARFEQAGTYHNLGAVAQEQRQWPQAEHYYQQALQIYIEYNDRFEQARTYGQLGLMAWDQRQWEQACEYLLQALDIFMEYKDNHNIGIALRSLARLWNESSDANIPTKVASAIGWTVEEVEAFFHKVIENDASEDDQQTDE
jgi:tetratricopeptide (TPR) repeat protein